MEDLCAGVLEQISALHVATPPKLTRLRIAGGKTTCAAVSSPDPGSLEPLASRAASLPTATPFNWDRFQYDASPRYTASLVPACDQRALAYPSPSDEGDQGAVLQHLSTRPGTGGSTSRISGTRYGKPEVRRSLFASASSPRTPSAPRHGHCTGFSAFGHHSTMISPLAPFASENTAELLPTCPGAEPDYASPVSSYLGTTCRLPEIQLAPQPDCRPWPATCDGSSESPDEWYSTGPPQLSAFSSCDSERSTFSPWEPPSVDDAFPCSPAESSDDGASAKRTAEATTPRSPAPFHKRRRKLSVRPRLFGHW